MITHPQGEIETMKPHSRPVRTFAISATSFLFTLAATLLVLTALAACTRTPGNTAAAGKKTDKKTMRAFASEEEMKAYFRRLAEERKQRDRRERAASGTLNNSPAPPAPVAQASADNAKSGAKDDESVTNTQHAG